MRSAPLPAALALLLAAAPASAFDAAGEVVFTGAGIGGSAAFDADQVIGPSVNLSRMEGGAWSGDILGNGVALEVSGTRLRAPNFDLHVEVARGVTSVRGNVFGRRYSFELGPGGLSGRIGPCSVDLKRQKSGVLTGPLACDTRRGGLPDVVTGTTLRLVGQAGEASPPMPQLALALIAAFP